MNIYGYPEQLSAHVPLRCRTLSCIRVFVFRTLTLPVSIPTVVLSVFHSARRIPDKLVIFVRLRSPRDCLLFLLHSCVQCEDTPVRGCVRYCAPARNLPIFGLVYRHLPLDGWGEGSRSRLQHLQVLLSSMHLSFEPFDLRLETLDLLRLGCIRRLRSSELTKR